ncbi:MAG: alpha-L-fucosidase, partial [Clostridia bacterium]|nr:alpha-L-fucosidase [Clostridia bacterium]
MDNKKWFFDAKFGMMIHWGLYSLLGGEWKGERMAEIGEWAQEFFRIPGSEYHKLTAAFNPVYFDAEEWVCLAKKAGMKYLVFTSKHHDGFAMYHSKASAYNVFDATPFKRDPVAELAAACKKYGLKLGLYYSQDLDWE